MFNINWQDTASAEEIATFNAMIEVFQKMEIAARDEGDPLLFHGCTPEAASSILENGPTSWIRHYENGLPRVATGLHFGTISAAQAIGSLRSMTEQPVFLAIRASELAAAGVIYPDSNIIECGGTTGGNPIWADRPSMKHPIYDAEDPKEVEGLDWRISLEVFGAVAFAGEGPIPGLKAMGPDVLEARDPFAGQEINEAQMKMPEARV